METLGDVTLPPRIVSLASSVPSEYARNPYKGRVTKNHRAIANSNLLWCIRSSLLNNWALYADPFLLFEQ